MLTPMLLSMYATNLTYAGAKGMLGATEARTNLAGSMAGGESPAQVAFAGISDRAYALEAANASTMYQVGLALQESARKMQKADLDQKRRLMENCGAIFV